jgi:hypothetical protein
MATMKEYVAAVYATMDPATGMLPQHDCKGCGKPLNANGVHPAELYAGTYTGLCYACQSAGPVEMETHEITGAIRVSHPPTCPSWRRDRVEQWWFRDCDNPKCRKGQVIMSRPDSHGGSYGSYCPKCFARHYDHPVLADLAKRQREYSKAATAEQRRLSDKWAKACKAAGAPDDIKDPIAAELAKPYLAQYEQWKAANPRPVDYDMDLMPKPSL